MVSPKMCVGCIIGVQMHRTAGCKCAVRCILLRECTHCTLRTHSCERRLQNAGLTTLGRVATMGVPMRHAKGGWHV